MRRPKLKAVEAIPVEMEGKRAVALRDPEGLCAKVLFVPEPLLGIVALLDGLHSVEDILKACRRPADAALKAKDEKIISILDDASCSRARASKRPGGASRRTSGGAP